MKTIKQARKYFRDQIDILPAPKAKRGWHYGRCELMQLMDFIYEVKPIGCIHSNTSVKSKAEELQR